jgi:pyrroline-5-carboxylate reductase
MFTGDRFGVIGAGNMAEAIVLATVTEGLFNPSNIVACDPDGARREVFASMGAETSPGAEAVADCDLVMISVKPQAFADAVAKVAHVIKPDALVFSIAAGITTDKIASLLPPGTRIVRVMPNTPIMAGFGVAGICRGENASDEDVERVATIFRTAGTAYEVEEGLMDAVTAVSGSGPAYFFRLAELLGDAGVMAGLPEELSRAMAAETMIGAARLLEETSQPPEELRRIVTSPGGTTAAALEVMDNMGLGKIMAEAVAAAVRRGAELGK